MNLPPDFREFLQLLNAACIDYAVVGGYAVGRHGHPRFTGDIDILIRPERENVEKVVHALDEFGFGSLGITLDDFLAPGMVIQLGVAPLRIDLITSIDGVSNDEIFANRLEEGEKDSRVFFIGRAQLIKNKRASGRPKDLADLEYIEPEQ